MLHLVLTEINYHSNARHYCTQTRLLPGRLAPPPPSALPYMFIVGCLMAQNSKLSKNRHHTDEWSHFGLLLSSRLMRKLFSHWDSTCVLHSTAFVFYLVKTTQYLKWNNFTFLLIPFWTCWWQYVVHPGWMMYMHMSPPHMTPVINSHVIWLQFVIMLKTDLKLCICTVLDLVDSLPWSRFPWCSHGLMRWDENALASMLTCKDYTLHYQD